MAFDAGSLLAGGGGGGFGSRPRPVGAMAPTTPASTSTMLGAPSQPAGRAGKPKTNTQSTTSQIIPTPEQDQLVKLGLDKITGFTPPPQQVAPFNPTQIASQNQALGSTGVQGDLAARGADATKFALWDALFPGSNPALQATIDAANTAGQRNLQRNILPSIRSDAVMSGQYGGSRQGIAEGIAASDEQRNASDRAAQISTAGYNSGLQSMIAALGYLPQTQGAQVAPAATTAAVGDAQQGQQQAQLDAQYTNAMFPWLQGQDLIALSSGLPGGTGVTTTETPRQGPLAAALGGAATGAGLAAGHPLLGAILGGIGGLIGR